MRVALVALLGVIAVLYTESRYEGVITRQDELIAQMEAHSKQCSSYLKECVESYWNMTVKCVDGARAREDARNSSQAD